MCFIQGGARKVYDNVTNIIMYFFNLLEGFKNHVETEVAKKIWF